jgi:hypothetical protein
MELEWIDDTMEPASRVEITFVVTKQDTLSDERENRVVQRSLERDFGRSFSPLNE